MRCVAALMYSAAHLGYRVVGVPDGGCGRVLQEFIPNQEAGSK
jgi:hypothetical protein